MCEGVCMHEGVWRYCYSKWLHSILNILNCKFTFEHLDDCSSILSQVFPLVKSQPTYLGPVVIITSPHGSNIYDKVWHILFTSVAGPGLVMYRRYYTLFVEKSTNKLFIRCAVLQVEELPWLHVFYTIHTFPEDISASRINFINQSASIARYLQGVYTVQGKKITAGHRPKTDQKAGMTVYLLNSPDIKPTRAREINIELKLVACLICRSLQSIMSMRNYVDL